MSSNSVGCSSVAIASSDLNSFNQQFNFVEWNEGAVVLEMKVNEPAVVSIFCPLAKPSEKKCVEVVKFAYDSIEFIRDLTPENSETPTLKRYVVTFPNQRFEPETVNSELWSESRRLFTCRVNVEYKDYVCGLRRFSEIQAYMSSKVPLQQCCERLSKNGVKIACRVCLTTFLETNEASQMKFVMMSDDPILDELGNCSLNDFVVHSCANQHGCQEKPNKFLNATKNKDKLNQPTKDMAFISDTHLTLHKADELACFVIDGRVIKCKGCVNELGHISKTDSDTLKLHLTGLSVKDQNLNQDMIVERFESLERYFAFLLLHHSGIDSSLKLMFRTCENEAYVLIWLIEPIFVFGGGKFNEVLDEGKQETEDTKMKLDSSSDTSIINTFCTIRVLYKVFDSAAMANACEQKQNDPSISYIDIPLSSCMALEEILLRNSTRLPHCSRTLGNFLISFLSIEDE